MIDFIIIVSVKLLLMGGFISGLRYWLLKTQSQMAVIMYWFLGFFFVLMLATHLFEGLLMITLFKEGVHLRDRDSIQSLGVLLGLVFYIYIGSKYFKRNQNAIIGK